MTTTPSGRSQRCLDPASLALLLVGLASGAFACWLIAARGANLLVIAPSLLAASTGVRHLVKREAPRLHDT